MSRRLVFGTGHWIGFNPIGEIAGRSIYSIRGAEAAEGDDSEDGDQDEESEKDSEDKDDNEDSDADEGGRKPKRAKQSSSDESSVIRRMRTELRQARKEIASFRDAKKKADLADASDVEKVTAELTESREKLAEIEPRYHDAQTELEIIKASSRLKFNWADIEDVLNDRKLRNAIEFDEETGEINGVEDALKDLKKRKPHFLAKPEDDEEDDGKENGPKRTGASFNGTKTKKQSRAADRDRLVTKYPVLGRMQDGG